MQFNVEQLCQSQHPLLGPATVKKNEKIWFMIGLLVRIGWCSLYYSSSSRSSFLLTFVKDDLRNSFRNFESTLTFQSIGAKSKSSVVHAIDAGGHISFCPPFSNIHWTYCTGQNYSSE